MTALPTLTPSGGFAVVSGSWTNEAGGAAAATDIDETSAGDSDYIRTALNAGAVFKVDLANTPGDFVTMNTLSIEARHSRGTVEAGTAGGGNDTYQLWTYITDSAEAVQLAGGNSTLANGEMINTSTIGYLTKTQTQAYTYVNLTATKTQWDGAKLFVESVFTASGGGDGHRMWVDFVRAVSGDYDASGPPAVIPAPVTRRRPMRSLVSR